MRKVNETLHARIDALMDGGEKRLTFDTYPGSAEDWQRELRAALIELLVVDYEGAWAPGRFCSQGACPRPTDASPVGSCAAPNRS